MGETGPGDTGANDGTDNGNGWNDENSGTLWGWLSSVVGGLETVWEAVTNLPQLILDGIKAIFIPDTQYIETAFQGFVYELKMKFNFDTEFFEGLWSDESPVTDQYFDYSLPGVGSFNLKILDASFFVQGVTYFRPFIRGFIVLLLVLYNIKKIIGFFGYDAGVVTGRNEQIAEAKNAQK